MQLGLPHMLYCALSDLVSTIYKGCCAAFLSYSYIHDLPCVLDLYALTMLFIASPLRFIFLV